MHKKYRLFFGGLMLMLGHTSQVLAQCTTWQNPTPSSAWQDFNQLFGGAPDPDTCPFNENTVIQVFAAEAYAMDNIVAGMSYQFSTCNGDSGTWPIDFTILTPSNAVDAFGLDPGSTCQITWTASTSGTYKIVINEQGQCGGGANTSTNNGHPAITCLPQYITVNSVNDGPVNLSDAEVTLRDAIEAANNDVAAAPGGVPGSGADFIDFDPGLIGNAFVLNQGELNITESLTIQGLGLELMAISGDFSSRLFRLGGDGNNTYQFKDLYLAQGNGVGGGISGRGGVLYMDDSSDVVRFDGVIFSDNSAPDNGAALAVSNGTLVVNNSSFSLHYNSQSVIHLQDATAEISNTTLSGNSSSIGAIWVQNIFSDTHLKLINTTIAHNSSAGVHASAEGFFNTTVEYANSVIANNSGAQLNEGNAIGSVDWISNGHNIISDFSSPSPAPSDLINTDPGLQPLKSFGGQLFHPLKYNSPAVDAATAALAPLRDQLGHSRVDGDFDGNIAPDIGAAEYGFDVIFVTGF